jgi:hypothetical protein
MITTNDKIAKHAAEFGINTVTKESLMEALMYMACGMTPSAEEKAFFQVPELLILHTETLSAADLDLIEAIRADNKFTI